MVWVVFVGISFPLNAENKPVVVDTIDPVHLRSFDTIQLKQYANNPEFNYDRKPPPHSLLDQFWQWLFGRKMDKLGGALSDTWLLIRYIVVFLLVCLVIRQLLKANMSTLFFRPPPSPNIAYEVLEENIHEIDFDEQIQKAIAQQAYRKAVRLYYLKSLKTLTDKGVIQWTPDKTNQRYVYELRKHHLQQPFRELTYLFDYVWYGDFTLNQETFNDAQHQFIQFQQQIQQHS